MTTPTTDQIRELRELMAKATPLPWRSYRCDAYSPVYGGADDQRVADRPSPNIMWQEDAALIVALRNLAPALLDRLETGESQMLLSGAIAVANAEIERLKGGRDGLQIEVNCARNERDSAIDDWAAMKAERDAALAKLAEAEKERDEFAGHLGEQVSALMEKIEILASERDQARAEVEAMKVQVYDLVYKGEPPEEREVRWKWVMLGISELQAKVERLRGVLEQVECDAMNQGAEWCADTARAALAGRDGDGSDTTTIIDGKKYQ